MGLYTRYIIILDKRALCTFIITIIILLQLLFFISFLPIMGLVKRTHDLDARQVIRCYHFIFLSGILHTLDGSHLCSYWCFHHEFDTKPFTLDLQMKRTIYKTKVFECCNNYEHASICCSFFINN